VLNIICVSETEELPSSDYFFSTLDFEKVFVV